MANPASVARWEFENLRDGMENRFDGIESRLDHMATKEDLERFATKEDLNEVKEDLKRFATKEDLKRFATKEDLNEALVPIYRHLGDLDKKVDAIPGIVARLDGIDTRLEVIESGISGIMDYLINRSDD